MTIKNSQRLTINPLWKRCRELNDKTPKLHCLEDSESCSEDVTQATISIAGFEICTLLMHVICDGIADTYDCLQGSVPTNPNKLVKDLITIKNKLKSNTSAIELHDCDQVVPHSDV